MSSTISLSACRCPGVSLNGSTFAADSRMRSSTVGTNGFGSTLRCVAPPGVPDLEEEELLEDQPPLRRRPKRIQLVDRRLVGREVRLLQRHAPRHEASRSRNPGGNSSEMSGGNWSSACRTSGAACSASPFRSSRRTGTMRAGPDASERSLRQTSSYSGS